MKASEIARTFIGQREGKQNYFDQSTPLGRAIESVGQADGQAWCAYFIMYCVRKSDSDSPKLDTLAVPSAVQTFNNLKKAGFRVINLTKDKPDLKRDYVVAWQSYKGGVPQWTGHIGLLDPASVRGVDFKSIEGNAAEKGVTREGVMVAEVSHRADELAYKVNDGLRLLGIIEI